MFLRFNILLSISLVLCCFGQHPSTCAAQDRTGQALYSFSAIKHTSVYMPLAEEIPAGHYSGITYLGGTKFAVVNDKMPGCGLMFFDISIDSKGSITYVAPSSPSSTSSSSDTTQSSSSSLSTSAVPTSAVFSSKVSGLDNEGVVFVPSNRLRHRLLDKTQGWRSSDVLNPESGDLQGTLFISSERAQTIVEYNLDGEPTGRQLNVPDMFAKAKIVSNNGFEALAYNIITDKFWTTTERPLKADSSEDFMNKLGAGGPVLRIQSFTSDLESAGQYFYVMDRPVKTEEEGAAARAYVHGVSAMTALDDGSLLVLEREVFVPKGGTLALMLNSFSKMKIYRVEPPASLPTSVISHSATQSEQSKRSEPSKPSEPSELSELSEPSKHSEPSKPSEPSKHSESSKPSVSSEKSSSKNPTEPFILSKKLITTFSTSSMNLANYEGMCLGPDLPGGWHTLVLIADSQGGQGGLTNEYIKVITFK